MENKKKKTEDAAKAVKAKNYNFKPKNSPEGDQETEKKASSGKRKATFYLENDTLILIDAMAKYHGLSQSEIITRAVDKSAPDKDKYLNQQKEDF